ncbi:MAG: hypothetical protein ACX931_06835 [Saccharospirillum sp.]
MYVEPLTLFILIEIAVVYVIITAFLFYKGRLYHLLVALLKEMRWNRLQRQQQVQQEVAALRAQNQQLMVDRDQAQTLADSAGQTMPQQLEHHLQTLEDRAAAEDAQGTDDSRQLSRLRREILRLEQQLLSGSMNEAQWQSQLTDLLAESNLHPTGGDEAPDETGSGDEELRAQLASANDRLALMEKELTALRAINKPEESELERPQKGMYADEIYKLKCEKFDMQEALNKARLMLQQMNPDDDGFQETQEEYTEQLDQYIKRADVSLNLMEKELEAVNHENEALEAQVKELKNRLKDISVVSDKASTINQDNVHQLVENASKKAAALSNLRNSIEQMRRGTDPESVLELQEGEINRLELLVRDSENCISVLEMELENALRQIEQLSEQTSAPGSQALPETELNDRLTELNDAQQQSLDNLKGHLEAIRGGGDAMEIIIAQEEDINQLDRQLKETQALVGQLQMQLAEQSEPDKSRKASERPDSDEDMQEMESLVKEFITDMQSMMTKIKALEEENKKLSKAG